MYRGIITPFQKHYSAFSKDIILNAFSKGVKSKVKWQSNAFSKGKARAKVPTRVRIQIKRAQLAYCIESKGIQT